MEDLQTSESLGAPAVNSNLIGQRLPGRRAQHQSELHNITASGLRSGKLLGATRLKSVLLSSSMEWRLGSSPSLSFNTIHPLRS
jgi:hypothetical protein